MPELSADEALLAELGVEVEAPQAGGPTATQERVIAGFEDILRFVETHGRPPRHGDQNDIFERLYAVRLDRLRALEEYHDLLAPFDKAGLLATPDEAVAEDLDDDALLAELGLGAEPADDDIRELRHVRPRAEVRAAEEVAGRSPCPDFARFEPLFGAVRTDLASGARETRRFGKNADISAGEFFIVGGQMAYVAAVGEEFVTGYDRPDSRLRVIYDNGTESDILRRSLQRALYKDEAGRRITSPDAGPLFGDTADDDELASGTIYILRSLSEHPEIAQHRELVHKIGVTGGPVEQRIVAARESPTFLFADVEVLTTYKLYNINRTRLENLLHRVFAPAQLDLELPDRFGRPFRPREWFLVPLPAIDEAVSRIRDGSIANYRYDPAQARLVQVG